MILQTQGPCEGMWFSAQHDFCCELEKVQKVSALSPIVAKVADTSEN